MQWTSDRRSSEAFLALPITRAGALTGVLLAGTSLSAQLGLERSILRIGVVVGASGIVIGVLLGGSLVTIWGWLGEVFVCVVQVGI